MCIALKETGFGVERQKGVAVYFRGQNIGDFKLDLIVDDKILLELKAVSSLVQAHEAQVLNYLHATELEFGLLFNFGDKPQFKRFAYGNENKIRVYPRLNMISPTVYTDDAGSSHDPLYSIL